MEGTATFAICVSGYVDDGWDNSGRFIEVYDTDGSFTGASIVPDFEEEDSFVWMNRPINGKDFNSYAPPWLGAEGEGERLFEAINVADVQEIKKILAAGVDINIRDSNGQSAILLAANIGNVEVIEILLNAGFDVNTTVSRRGQEGFNNITYWLPLTAAIGNCHIEVVRVLLSAGVDVKEIEHNIFLTPLCLAIEQNQIEITRLLLDAGANPNHYLELTKTLHRSAQSSIARSQLDEDHYPRCASSRGSRVLGTDLQSR